MQTIRIVINTVKAYYEEILFFFITGTILCVATLLVLPMPFALAGVWMVAHRAVRGLGVNWKLYWGAVKEYGLRSLRLTLILAFGYVLLVVNAWFYSVPDVSPFSTNVSIWIRLVVFIIGVVWISISFYAHAFLIELEEPKLLTILRSSLSLTLVNPLTTLLLLTITFLVAVVSIGVPVLLPALPGFIATLSITAVRTLIAAFHEKYGLTEAKNASKGSTE